MTEPSKYLLLCSGVTLGAYVPGVILDRKLKMQGLDSSVMVLEKVFRKHKQQKLDQMKKEFHESFAFALLAQKLSSEVEKNFDPLLVQQLYRQWDKFDNLVFVIFSGFWVKVLNEYLATHKSQRSVVHVIHLDATISSSWKNASQQFGNWKHHWLFSLQSRKINYSFGDLCPDVQIDCREQRLIAHGGGWGIGTYKAMTENFSMMNYGLDLLTYNYSELDSQQENGSYLLDPTWKPWEQAEGVSQYPPLFKMQSSELEEIPEVSGISPFQRVVAAKIGIMSKPGGGTLIDSLICGTPLILLDPFGDYEKANASLWEHFGLGIQFNKWKSKDFSKEVLAEMQENIFRIKSKSPDIADSVTES